MQADAIDIGRSNYGTRSKRFGNKEGNVRLYIAGVNHFDPSCRAELVLWLERLKERETSAPAFVAVEYDENFFKAVVPQREQFRAQMADVWPDASPCFLDTLAASLIYDADTHRVVFPDAEVVWMVEVEPSTIWKIVGDKLTPTETTDGGASDYSQIRANIYQANLGSMTPADDEKEMLTQLSVQAWGGQDQRDLARDKQFALAILDKIADQGGGWAIVIVGASHASDDSESMRSVLERSGMTSVATVLRPSAF